MLAVLCNIPRNAYFFYSSQFNLLLLFTYYYDIIETVYKDDNRMQLNEPRAIRVLICMHWYFKPVQVYDREQVYLFADRRLSRRGIMLN